jgi:serine-type D-Ala-D-Ala carboxypeptidase/endopeptidase (penicillin-binding protein 4)
MKELRDTAMAFCPASPRNARPRHQPANYPKWGALESQRMSAIKQRGKSSLVLGAAITTWWLVSASPASSAPEGAASSNMNLETPREPAPSAKSPALESLRAWAEKHHVALGVHVLDLETDKRLDLDGSRTLNPASNMKLLTAIAALDELGAGFRFETGLYGSIEDGTVRTLTLRGNGDPALATSHLWELTRSLTNMGVRQVDDLVIDQSRFDDQFIPPAFEQQPAEWAAFRAPVSAIALERNSVTLNVLPTADGQPARVWFEPEGTVTQHGEVQTVKEGKGQDVRLTLRGVDGGLEAELGGYVASSLGRLRFDKRIDDPRLFPGLALRHLLTQRGVKVEKLELGTTSEKRRLVYHASAPLSELLTELGKNSDNFYAEMIFKGLSVNRKAAPLGLRASTQDSCVWLTEWLTRLDETAASLRCVNGSGLFDANRVSARSLVQVLSHAYASPRLRAETLAHLAVGGADGTLRSRFRDASTQFPVRAKTGTLRDTIALTGYVLRPGTRPPVVFSVLVNGLTGGTAEARQQIDKFVRSLQN